MEEEQTNQSAKQLNHNGNRRGMHPNSRKNLLNGRRWVKGQSGCLRGRTLSVLLDEELGRIPTIEDDGFDGKGKSNAQWFIKNQVRDARSKSDNQARKEIWERIEGKVTQPISGEGGGPVKHEITVSSDMAKQLTEQIIKGENT